MLGLADLGTGQGTQEAADRAFRAGLEDFTFNRRPLLPPTTQTPAQQAPSPERPALPREEEPADEDEEEVAA